MKSEREMRELTNETREGLMEMNPASEKVTPSAAIAPQVEPTMLPGPTAGIEPRVEIRARPSGARALVTVLGVVAFAGLTILMGYVLDVFLGPDPEASLGVVIVGAAVLLVSVLPLLVLLLLPWWKRSVAAPLREEGRGRAIRILWWSAGACGLGMLYALRYLAHNPGDWHDVLDEEITLVPLLVLILVAFLAMAAGAGWAKVMARVAFIVFFLPWILYNPIGSLVGLGIMVFGLRSLRDVQPEIASAPALWTTIRWSPDGAHWWDGSKWQQASPDRKHYWDGFAWQRIDDHGPQLEMPGSQV